MRFILLFIILIVQIYGDEDAYNRGEMLFFANACSSCHGPSAEGSSTYPRLANKKEEYLKKKLIDFRAGKAKSVSQQMMAQFAKKLTDKDIDDLSFFLSAHKKVHVEDVEDDILGGFGS
ncbi:c-type cytochrome [Sulfurimonas autotrophica]|uniref:Cytochrome c class I n=1 Tax=Sulfurimonas autotrophica (strain ATCC BAA-671 / DSM 16294 / JCM 11897 / OK10) TaxID=563040 RepID=E0UPD1_SULAO|nr:c-type cytochrome [Sulfurimonas autotrophica]ADN09661.1 cytochrome c class I [Sulfurimonas autotrophica DSM 16294]